MISYVKGTLSEIIGDVIVVEAGSVGINIHVPLTVMDQLPSPGEEVMIFTYLKVSEDALTLYGFNSRRDLDMRDLCSLDILPDILEAGVTSLKIEGRMKSPRYTAGTVSVWRKYLDLYYEKGRSGYSVEKEDRGKLLDLFDRGGQTTGYFTRHNGPDMMAMNRTRR